MISHIIACAKENNISLIGSDGADKSEVLAALCLLLKERSQVQNLTAITDEAKMALLHISDSIIAAPFIPEGASLADIGAGAGFPSLPIAIMRPDVQVTAVESTGKKCDYIRYAAESLGLTNVRVINARAEEAAQLPDLREKFDAVTARAVARLNVLSELCLPFVKVGGVFLPLKSEECREELAEASAGIRKLGGKISGPFFDGPLSYGEIDGGKPVHRVIPRIEKIARTEKTYPRKYAQIQKKPL